MVGSVLLETFRLENRTARTCCDDPAAPGGMTGHVTALGHEPHHYTIFYVDVEDVKKCLDKAESLGGKTLVPPVEIPTGTFAWMQDPEGNTVGLWKAKQV